MNNDFISRSEAKKLGATCLARRNENGQLEAIISLDNAPTVKTYCYFCGQTEHGQIEERPEGLPENNWGKWIISEVKCPHCFEYFDPDYYSKEELNKCPSCGADLRGGAEQ